jgi:ATP-dependent RNA helicase DDX10/DBP4
MPSEAVKRVRTGPSRGTARSKEAAELSRVRAAAAALPPLAARFAPARPNRRQRAAQRALEDRTGSDELALAEKAALTAAVSARRFADLPLSTRTLDGLAAGRFVETTDVQRLAVPQGLAGRDVLAAAPTGSGKTLAFIVPVIEALWRNKWSTSDGLGALILAPTRELALQIFEVLRHVAKFHMISAGLVIGGKDFEYEREKVGLMNVLVATPGRMLHHMDHVAELDCTGMQVLVLDEADRILDMGFARTLDAILQNLPSTRQTLLFSATQTKSVKALARLSLKDPEYVSVVSASTAAPSSAKKGATEANDATGSRNRGNRAVDEGDEAAGSESDEGIDIIDDDDRCTGHGNTISGESDVKIVGTPKGLSQSYTVVALQDKLSVLWSFIKTHIHSKIIVFFATGKQVRFVYDSFCKLRPGIPLLHIHGNMKQARRTDMYDVFCNTRTAVLFATDVASRGLDFPDVEWVVQVDCPDDVGSYVHRVGRTARFRANGRAMLFLNNGSEEVFLKRLESRKLVLNRTRINPERIQSITPKIAGLVSSSQELKSVAQRAFTFYLKSVHRQQDKEVFNAVDMDHGAFAFSLGLSISPKVTFKGPGPDHAANNMPITNDPAPAVATKRSAKKLTGGDGKTVFGYRTRLEVTKESKKADMETRTKRMAEHDADDQDDNGDHGGGVIDNDDSVLRVKTVYNYDLGAGSNDVDDPLPDPVQRKRKRIKLDVLKHGPSMNRIVFSEDGKAMRASELMHQTSGHVNESDADASGDDVAAKRPADITEYATIVAKRLAETADEDRAREHERVRSKHAKQRERVRLLTRGKRADGADSNGKDQHVESESDAEIESENDAFDAALQRIAARGGGSDNDEGDTASSSDGNANADVRDAEAMALQILAQRRVKN